MKLKKKRCSKCKYWLRYTIRQKKIGSCEWIFPLTGRETYYFESCKKFKPYALNR